MLVAQHAKIEKTYQGPGSLPENVPLFLLLLRLHAIKSYLQLFSKTPFCSNSFVASAFSFDIFLTPFLTVIGPAFCDTVESSEDSSSSWMPRAMRNAVFFYQCK